MTITPAHERELKTGPADWFTGQVKIDNIFPAEGAAYVQSALVAFQPGARTHWHTHPLGQTLYVVSGAGWAQSQGQPKQPLAPGDLVVFAPGEVHWHGAGAEAMSHIAIQGSADGGAPVTWGEPVVEES